jgi:multidrug efflux pump subunit AcrA (membrane-fusion protein)
MLRTKKRWFLLFVVLLAAAVVYGVTRVRSSAPSLATAQAVRGDFDITIKARGEVKALRSVTLVAPISLTDVQIVSLAPAGTLVKEGDVVIELDTTSQQDRLNQRMSAIKQVDAELDRLKALNRIQDEQDNMDLAQAQFNVARAKLEVSKQEIVSEIEAGKAKLTLKNTERSLEEVKERILAHKRGQAADADAVLQRRKKAEADVALSQKNLERMAIKSPISGILQVLPNGAAGRRMFGGGGSSSAPEYKPGDRAFPGAGIAEIPDLNSLCVDLAIEETDRGRVSVGQTVRVKVDALADVLIPGVIESISPLSQVNYSVRPPQKTFRAVVKLDLSKLGALIKTKPPAQAVKAELRRDAGAGDGMRGEGRQRGGGGERGPGASDQGGRRGGEGGERTTASRREGAPEGGAPGSRPEGAPGSERAGQQAAGGAAKRAGPLQSEETLKKLKEKGIDPEDLMKKFREGGEARAQAIQQLKDAGIDFGGRRPREGGEGGAEGPGQGRSEGRGGRETRAEGGEGGAAGLGMPRERRGGDEGEPRQSGQSAMRGEAMGAVGQMGAGGAAGFGPGSGAGPRSGDSGAGPRGAPAIRAESTLRPGMSAGGDIVIQRLKDVVLVPVRATFDRSGKVIVYVKKGRNFEAREIVIGYKGEAQVEVKKGLQPGEVVALEEPASAKEKKS